MSNIEKSMEEIFELSPLTQSNKAIKEAKSNLPAPVDVNTELAQDLSDAYEQTKDNLQELISQGMEAMEEILAIAKEGQHPRAFEVLAKLMDTMLQANKDLLELQKQIREMDKEKGDSKTTNIDKAIFVGSTTELAKMIKDMNK